MTDSFWHHACSTNLGKCGRLSCPSLFLLSDSELRAGWMVAQEKRGVARALTDSFSERKALNSISKQCMCTCVPECMLVVWSGLGTAFTHGPLQRSSYFDKLASNWIVVQLSTNVTTSGRPQELPDHHVNLLLTIHSFHIDLSTSSCLLHLHPWEYFHVFLSLISGRLNMPKQIFRTLSCIHCTLSFTRSPFISSFHLHSFPLSLRSVIAEGSVRLPVTQPWAK